MKERSLAKASFYIAVAGLVLCLVFGAVTVFAWLNLTPETVGEAAYGVLHIALPFLMILLGSGFGYSLRYLIARKESRELERATADTIARLEKERDDALAGIASERNTIDVLRHELGNERAEKEVLYGKLREGGLVIDAAEIAAEVKKALEADRKGGNRLVKVDNAPNWAFEQRENGNLTLRWVDGRRRAE